MKKPTIKTYRRAFQIFVVVAFIVIPILNRSRYSMVYGNFLSFHMFGIPLADPLAVLQLTIKNLYFTLDNFIGTLLPLMLAFFMGTVFCSWVCPYGLFSEWVQGFRKKVLPKGSLGLNLKVPGFGFKFIIFILGFVGFLIFSTTPILNQLSTAAWYARFFQYYYGQDFISLCYLFILGLLLVEFLAGKRLWCRYVCPQSILIILTKLLNKNRMKVAFAEEKCICKPGYEKCEPACTLALNPKIAGGRIETECTNCSDCILACNKMGKALQFEFAPGGSSSKFKQFTDILPDRRVFVRVLFGLALLAGLGYGGYTVLTGMQSGEQRSEIVHPLLSKKKISWHGGKADTYELLSDGTVVCVGGQWPETGFKGWRWEPVDENGSLKIIPDEKRPEIFTVLKFNKTIAVGTTFSVQHSNGGIGEDQQDSTISAYADLDANHRGTAISVDGRAFITRYSDEIHVMTIEVGDYHGVIRRIPIEGVFADESVMLTNAKMWRNNPDIIVSEGKKPAKLPITTVMEVRYHDGHVETATFQTKRIINRSKEVYEDLWF